MMDAFVRRSECVPYSCGRGPMHPLVDEAGIRPRAHVPGMVVSAWEDKIVERSASAFQSCAHRFPGRLYQFELHRLFRLRLHDDSSVPNAPSGHDVANAYLDHVAAAQLAIDREVEQRPFTSTPVPVEAEADRPHLLLLQRALGA